VPRPIRALPELDRAVRGGAERQAQHRLADQPRLLVGQAQNADVVRFFIPNLLPMLYNSGMDGDGLADVEAVPVSVEKRV